MADNSPSTSTGLNLDTLPDDIYQFAFFRFFSLDEILEFRLISKSFYSIVKLYASYITQLSFIDHVKYNLNDYKCNWFSTSTPIKFKNQLDSAKLNLLSNPSYSLLNLKCLRIKNTTNQSIRIEDINKFTKLEILILHTKCTWSRDHSDGHLQLPELKALSLDIETCRMLSLFCPLVIDTPSLHSLCAPEGLLSMYLQDQRMVFSYPLSVKYLQLDYYRENDLSLFENLECLELNCLSDGVIDVHTTNRSLSSFRNLKKLKINSYPLGRFFQPKAKLRHLFSLKRSDLEFVFCGVKIEEENKIDEHREKYSLFFHLENYGHLEDDLDFFKVFHYEQLVGRPFDFVRPTHLLNAPNQIGRVQSVSPSIGNNQLANLTTKYTNIQQLNVCRTSSINDNLLINCIKNSPNLYKLSIFKGIVSQEFYDQLPLISSLTDLITEDVEMNYEFINKMTYLRVWQSNEDVLLKKEFDLNNLKYFKEFSFKVNFKVVYIIKEMNDKYILKGLPNSSDTPSPDRMREETTDQQYFNLKRLIKWIYYLRCTRPNISQNQQRNQQRDQQRDRQFIPFQQAQERRNRERDQIRREQAEQERELFNNRIHRQINALNEHRRILRNERINLLNQQQNERNRRRQGIRNPQMRFNQDLNDRIRRRLLAQQMIPILADREREQVLQRRINQLDQHISFLNYQMVQRNRRLPHMVNNDQE